MPPSVRSALGLKREDEDEEEEEEELNCFDTYPVEQFWGSPFCSYYIKGHELGLNGWYVVEIRLMREKFSTKSSPLVWREYVVATVAKTETRDPTGNGYLCFERSEEREPIPETLQGIEEPDRERETEIFVEKKPYTGRPYPKDYLKYLSYVRNPVERYKYVDRVRILANPWLHRGDVVVAFLQLPPPELGKAHSKTLRGNSTHKTKSKWLFVSDLVYIARQLNRQRELYYIFPRTAHWLAGMIIHVVRIWTGAPVNLINRRGKKTVKIAPGMDMVAWHASLQLAAERDQTADKTTYEFDDALRAIKLPRNYTVRALVEQYWHHCTTADIIGMFVKIEMRERGYQIKMERQFRIELAEQQKKVQEAIKRIREMKDRDSHRKKVDRRIRKKEVKKTPQEKLKEIKEKRTLRWDDSVTIGGGSKTPAESRTRGPKTVSDASKPAMPSKPILLPKISRPTDLRPGSYHLPPTKVWRSQQKALKRADSNRKSLFRFSLEGPKSRFGLAMFKEREVDKERLKKQEEEKQKEKEREKEKEKEKGKEKGNDKDKDKVKGREREKEKVKVKDNDRAKDKGKEKEKEKVEGKGKELAKAKEKGKELKMVRWLSGK